MNLLENANIRLPNGICLAGVSDPAARGFGEPVPDIVKAVRGIPQGSFILLLAHWRRRRPAGSQLRAVSFS
ncbi:MAG: hypothetical protein IKO93_01645 [Lentisphaeria bacterium]|nr:hypothetical protein [Lentisphaeria bacterium]